MEHGRAIERTRRPHAQLRLFCFPYAGGSAYAFRTWLDAFPLEIDVCPIHLPGRGRRFQEPCHTQLEPLVLALHGDLRPHLDLPFAFFGHSLGAIVAFELARLLTFEGTPPACLFVSGRRAPQCHRDDPPRYTLPDDEFLACVCELEGMPDEVLRDRGIMELMLPILRADFAVSETYRYRGGPGLACPISALGGTRDPEVSRDDVLGWREQTGSIFQARFFPGGHFFLHHAETQVLRAVTADLLRTLSVVARSDSDAARQLRTQRP